MSFFSDGFMAISASLGVSHPQSKAKATAQLKILLREMLINDAFGIQKDNSQSSPDYIAASEAEQGQPHRLITLPLNLEGAKSMVFLTLIQESTMLWSLLKQFGIISQPQPLLFGGFVS